MSDVQRSSGTAENPTTKTRALRSSPRDVLLLDESIQNLQQIQVEICEIVHVSPLFAISIKAIITINYKNNEMETPNRFLTL